MKQSEIMINTTFREIFDAPLIGGWDYFCDKYGWNVYMFNEGLADKDTETEISYNDAVYIGLVEDDND